MSEIAITALEPGRFGVQVSEGATTTSHKVAVPADMLDDLGLIDVDQEEVVRHSFEFLLDREPATSILRDFSLDQIPQHFDDYYDELRSRLAG